ncbi:hypothetical protein DMN91_012233 [Ooceraea biroi]|uniref:Uncharacterized protein n=1 Tax=Ooceraea biroi TaxID=2015173 RepID=A0A3L8D4R4_OOCBI|nr:uncharacterized protein LOC113563283 [Ooceraea biroi]RLU15239.1 hypothetical protein DMN91_012233 [Ooceraea biroi]
MKFLLLALLSCICSADDRRSRYTKQWARRIDSVRRSRNRSSQRESIRGLDGVCDARHHRYNFDPVSGRFHEDHIGDRVEVRHPIRHRHRQFRSMESNGYVAMKNWPVKKEACGKVISCWAA